MKLAILFWFYKEPEICKNRLETLRKYNPDTPIYGLYGGPPKEDSRYKSMVGSYLNDFYTFTQEKSSDWKWYLGDLLIADWYRERGKQLAWDSIVIVQWDMLVLGSVKKLFSMLEKDQILLSGLRPIKEVEHKWSWVSANNSKKLRQKYIEFLEYVKAEYNYTQEPLCCLFIVACLPRFFLDRYSLVQQAELGFLEYKIPIYAQIFKVPFCLEHPFIPWWSVEPISESGKILNAKRNDVAVITILKHLMNKRGARVFHPYRSLFPVEKKQWFWLFSVMLEDAARLIQKVKYFYWIVNSRIYKSSSIK